MDYIVSHPEPGVIQRPSILLKLEKGTSSNEPLGWKSI